MFPVAECPAIDDHKEMLGMRSNIMFRWDCGWSRGTTKRRHTRGTEYTYFVQYTEDDGSVSQYRHGLRPNNYYHEAHDDGMWFVIKQCDE